MNLTQALLVLPAKSQSPSHRDPEATVYEKVDLAMKREQEAVREAGRADARVNVETAGQPLAEGMVYRWRINEAFRESHAAMIQKVGCHSKWCAIYWPDV